MKKLFFIAAIAGVALASCVKNEPAPSVTQQDEITFLAPIVGPQTKVNGAIGARYDTQESFDVWCVHNVNDIQAWGGQVYFNDTKAEYDSQKDGWALNPKYYWPATGKLSFVAMSPSISNKTTYDATNGFKITVAWSQGSNEDNIVDLMYSDESRNNAKAEFDADSEEKNGNKNSYKGVDITFKHALSYIVFKIKTTADYSATTTFKLNTITLSNIYTTGTFTQNVTSGDNWTVSGNEVGTYVAFNNAEGLSYGSSAVDAPAETTKEIILLPQTLTAKAQQLKVNYQISTDNGETWIAQEQTVDVLNDSVTKWEMGKKYTYTLSIGMTEILLDPAVAEWTTEGTSSDILI